MKRKEKVDNNGVESSPDLLFISDLWLRKKISDSIRTISELYVVEGKDIYPEDLNKELRRIIVLYSASIVEALLLYLYKKKRIVIDSIDYKDVHTLPNTFQSECGANLVFAKQVKTPKHERELMLDLLLKLFTENGVISKGLSIKIKRSKDIRNTFHLSKSRTGLTVGKARVQASTEAIYETISVVKKNLKKELKYSNEPAKTISI